MDKIDPREMRVYGDWWIKIMEQATRDLARSIAEAWIEHFGCQRAGVAHPDDQDRVTVAMRLIELETQVKVLESVRDDLHRDRNLLIRSVEVLRKAP